MAEQKNTFEKGLIKDLNPTKQPENSYSHAVNMVRLSDKGDYYSLTNEKGTEVYCNLPNDFSVIGQCVLESDIILILCKNDLSASQIGIVDSNAIYTVKLNDINNELNLDLDHPIDIESRVLINSNRIIYFTDNKNPIRTIDLDDVPTIGNIDKLSSLIPKSNFPVVDNFLVKDSSTSLKCGAYQFAFRYLDNKGNITNISIPSPYTSIGQNSTSSGDQYQGGYSDIISGKSITLTINNVDTDYSKLEIIAIYYDFNNNIQHNVTAQIDIVSSTLVFEYKGEILYELTLEETQDTTINYSTAKCIQQKDGRLIISNLKENINVEANLQTIANNINLKYIVKTEAVPAYKTGNNTAFEVGYKRGEVYSFGFGVIYKNGSRSLVYHIPAPAATGTPGTIVVNANTTSKQLGTYLSTLNYPSGQGYPVGNIRYHVMPKFDDEVPYTITDINNGVVRILGVEPIFPSGSIPEWNSIKNEIQGIFIVRRSRNTAENISIFSQGISNYMMDLFTINNDGNENEESVASNGSKDFRLYPFSSKYLTKTPFLGGINLKGYVPNKDGSWDGTTSGNDGLQPINQPNAYTYIAGDTNQEALNTLPVESIVENSYGMDDNTAIGQLYKRLMVFYSPESELLPKIEANTFTKIKRVGQFTFTDKGDVRWQHSEYQNESGGGDGESELQKPPLYWNYFYASSVSTSSYSNNTINITKNFYIPRNSVIPSNYGTLNIVNSKQEEFLLLETENNDIFTNNEYTYKQYKVQNVDSGGGVSANDATTTIDQVKNIYELISENTSQYGSVSGQEYILCKYIVYDQSTTPNLDTYDGTDIFGGDIYITRAAFTNKVPIKSKAFFFQSGNNHFQYSVNNQSDSYGKEYLDFRSVIEFYVESTKNTDLRHSLPSGNGYYRYSTLGNTLITNPEFIDDTKSYNNQYDFENRLQLFFSKSDISNSGNSHYKTRNIWSDQTILGELRDRYRDIRPNNYYDIPFNTGEIWDTFVFNNILYLHTPKTLWRTFFNAIEQSASTAGQVTLGTGGVFPVNLPPQQVINQQGGYSGTISQWGGCNTPFGYIFPDALQGKVFLLSGEGLSEISMNGLTRFFNDNLSVLDTNYTNYKDNPRKHNDRGLLSAYDFELKRWILTKNHENTENKFTISYDLIGKQWCSYHTYQPNILILRDNKLFGLMNIENTGEIKLYKHNVGNYGMFYGSSIKNSILTIVVNESFNIEKVFDNLILSLDSSFANKIQAYRGNGDTLEVYNDRQHSGVVNLLWNNTYGLIPNRNEARVQMLRNNYNIKIPLNSLISDNNAIFDSNSNLITSNIDQNKLFRDRIKGNYCIIQFNFNNSDNYKLTLNQINSIFRQYKR
jgi:hypothetical protein